MALFGNKTELNAETSNGIGGTVLNREVSQPTELNNTANGTGYSAPAGTVLCGEYIVERELTVSTGEADILLCSKDGREYVAKIYRRRSAIKKEVAETLQEINSPYIAKTYAIGEWNGFPVEVMEYYKNGSLDGKTFPVDYLKSVIIPNLNEGLNALHKTGIIHRDLKPSNIMLSNDKNHVVILDFGISSVREDGSTVIRTKTGLTPEYSAPETFRNLFWTGSDYYSLGITIYQLYTGHTPYEGLDGEQMEQMIDLQRLPFPEDMAPEIKALISGLTYRDISTRRDMNNPNRRWGYEEVRNWLQGIPQPVPGDEHAASSAFPPFTFCGKDYTTLESLMDALNANWEDGKKAVFRGDLRKHFRCIDRDVSDIFLDAEDMVEEEDQDVLFFKTLCKIKPESKTFRWKGKVYADIQALGLRLLNELRQGKQTMNAYMDELLTKGLLSTFSELTGSGDQRVNLLQQFESKFQTGKNATPVEKNRDYYRLAYYLSGDKTLVYNGKTFYTPDDVVDYMNELLDQSNEKCEEFSRKLMPEQKTLDPQFENWLIAIGKGDEMNEWMAE